MKRSLISLLSIGAVGLVVACSPSSKEKKSEEPVQLNLAVFQPLPEVAASPKNQLTPEKIALGRALYLDSRFSKSKTISCNSCHNLKGFGVDGEKTSPGHEGKRGDRNSPTSYNAALHIAQFWDGRAADVEEQALGPVLNPVEMGLPSEREVVKLIKADKSYVESFKKAFPEEKSPITFKNFGKAIGAFERTLLTPSRFDAFLKGDKQALSVEEQKGLKTFMDSGCIACHNGVGLGGNSYQKLGLVKPYPTKDLGRFSVTKNEAEKFYFKTPSLRNIDKTAPYFHDGSIATLEEAVKLMGEYQLGKNLSDTEVASIVTFLRSLTGSHPELN